MRLLLELGADAAALAHNHSTPLHWACGTGDWITITIAIATNCTSSPPPPTRQFRRCRASTVCLLLLLLLPHPHLALHRPRVICPRTLTRRQLHIASLNSHWQVCQWPNASSLGGRCRPRRLGGLHPAPHAAGRRLGRVCLPQPLVRVCEAEA